jgi:hypothetical protein
VVEQLSELWRFMHAISTGALCFIKGRVSPQYQVIHRLANSMLGNSGADG